MLSVTCVRSRTHAENFERLIFFKTIFFIYEKMLQFPFMKKKTNHKFFTQFSVYMELHEKCTISIFPYMKKLYA